MGVYRVTSRVESGFETVEVEADDAGQAVAVSAAGAEVVVVRVARPRVSVSDEELGQRLTRWFTEWWDDPAEFGGWADADFLGWVRRTVDALRELEIEPGLEVSFLSDLEWGVDYAMVEVWAEEERLYRSVGTDLKGLTEEPELIGIAGVVSIARAVRALADPVR